MRSPFRAPDWRISSKESLAEISARHDGVGRIRLVFNRVLRSFTKLNKVAQISAIVATMNRTNRKPGRPPLTEKSAAFKLPYLHSFASFFFLNFEMVNLFSPRNALFGKNRADKTESQNHLGTLLISFGPLSCQWLCSLGKFFLTLQSKVSSGDPTV